MTGRQYSLEPVRNIYAELTRRFGDDPRALFWGGRREQLLRLEVLADIEPHWKDRSVIDIGCGFCDLFDVLKARGLGGRYTGVDVTDEIIKVAQGRHPGLDIINRDILAKPLDEKADYVMASGTFNLKFCEDMDGFIEGMLAAMFDHAKAGVAVNFLSTYVDFRHPQAHHTDPAWIFDRAKRLTKRVSLRHDYMPYEFTVYLYRDDRIIPSHVFAGWERSHFTEPG